MAAAHKPCYDGWETELRDYDRVWRVDLVVHFFTNGTSLQCSLRPVCTADGDEVAATTELSEGVESLVTVVVTSSPVRSNPSTRLLLECLASLDRHGGLASCRKLIMCDGFKVRKRSQRKVGVVTDEEAVLYREFVRKVACLCRGHAALRRTRVVRLARRQGSAYAIREAVQAHVKTPFVIIVPHDCVISRPVKLDAVAEMMHAHPQQINYVKLTGPSTATYADKVFSQYGVRVEPTREFGGDLALIPMVRYMDNVALVRVSYLRDTIFVPGSGVRRGTFIEDTYGKHTQMHAWTGSAEFAAKRPPRNGCFLLADGTAEPMMRHLDGKTYLDPEQRAEAGLPAYPTDWTAALRDCNDKDETNQDDDDDDEEDGDATDGGDDDGGGGGAESSDGAHDGDGDVEMVAMREAVCWDSLADGCRADTCTRIHPRHGGVPVCGRHATTLLELWGRRRRPPCPGDCGKGHPTLSELEHALTDALPRGSRLHAHVHCPPCFGDGRAQGSTRTLYVAPSDVSSEDADAALDARAPMPLRVAIDAGFDAIMSDGERKSLSTQCGLCHGLASLVDHRPHVRAPPTSHVCLAVMHTCLTHLAPLRRWRLLFVAALPPRRCSHAPSPPPPCRHSLPK